MPSSKISNNYDCTPLLPTDDDSKKKGSSSTDEIVSSNNRSWFRRMLTAAPLFEKNLFTIRAISRSGSDSGFQLNNSCSQHYGANGGYAHDKVCCTEKMNSSTEHSTKSIRIYWRVT